MKHDKLSLLRERRNWLLRNSDHTQLLDTDITETEKANWRTYRQKLRDLPTTNSDPEKIVFPAKPSESN